MVTLLVGELVGGALGTTSVHGGEWGTARCRFGVDGESCVGACCSRAPSLAGGGRGWWTWLVLLVVTTCWVAVIARAPSSVAAHACAGACVLEGAWGLATVARGAWSALSV